MATQKPDTEKQITARRRLQLQQLEAVIPTLQTKAQELKAIARKLALLESVSLGLYEEIDKLAKKAGAEEVTPLVLDQVNDVIRETKELVLDDPYVKRYHEFVPAGTNPQHRDVVLVLRQVRQGLDRFATEIMANIERVDTLLADARGVRIAVLFALQGHGRVTEGDLHTNEVTVQPRWKRGLPWHFEFDVLDRTDLPSFFAVE